MSSRTLKNARPKSEAQGKSKKNSRQQKEDDVATQWELDKSLVSPDGKIRCWGHTSPDFQRFHDEVWGRPEYDSFRLFEALSMQIMVSGLSWSTLWKKKEAFRLAFLNWDVHQVAQFGEADMQRLMENRNLIRYRRKLDAVVQNARVVSELERTEGPGAFSRLMWSFAPKDDRERLVQVELRDVKIREARRKLKPEDLQEADGANPTVSSAALAHELKSMGFQHIGPMSLMCVMQYCGLVNHHRPHCWAWQDIEEQRRRQLERQEQQQQLQQQQQQMPGQPQQMHAQQIVSSSSSVSSWAQSAPTPGPSQQHGIGRHSSAASAVTPGHVLQSQQSHQPQFQSQQQQPRKPRMRFSGILVEAADGSTRLLDLSQLGNNGSGVTASPSSSVSSPPACHGSPQPASPPVSASGPVAGSSALSSSLAASSSALSSGADRSSCGSVSSNQAGSDGNCSSSPLSSQHSKPSRRLKGNVRSRDEFLRGHQSEEPETKQQLQQQQPPAKRLRVSASASSAHIQHSQANAGLFDAEDENVAGNRGANNNGTANVGNKTHDDDGSAGFEFGPDGTGAGDSEDADDVWTQA